MADLRYDLAALAAFLEGEVKEKKLRDAIRRYSGAHSIQADLKAAQKAVEGLFEIQGADPETRGFVGSALMMNAIMLYARATITAGQGRTGIDIKRAYSAR